MQKFSKQRLFSNLTSAVSATMLEDFSESQGPLNGMTMANQEKLIVI